jgi:hypothetical protein
VKLVSPIGGDTGGSGNLSISLSNVARLRHIQNLCGFSTPTATEQSFTMTLYKYYVKHLDLLAFNS